MLKKILLLVSLSSLGLFALETGDLLPYETVKSLKLENNRVYIIDFFASWCKSCKKELPLMAKLHTQLDQNSTEIIGIDVDEDSTEGKAFQEEMGVNFRVIDDSKNELIKVFNPVGMPAIFIVKDEKIIATLIGAKEQIDKVILSGLGALE